MREEDRKKKGDSRNIILCPNQMRYDDIQASCLSTLNVAPSVM